MPDDFRPLTYDRGFKTLFEDSVYLLLASEKETDNDMSNVLARGSIACTMMLPEVCANICIESLVLENSIFRDVDKLAPLSKFDFFLRTSFRDRKIDNGCAPVQKAQELKRLRDSYVHPKKQAVVWEDIGDETTRGTSERTQFLDMSKNPSMWYLRDAEQAMRGAHEFLAYFFHGLCRFSKNRVTALLFSEDPDISASECGAYCYSRGFRKALQRWEIDISYFRIGAL